MTLEPLAEWPASSRPRLSVVIPVYNERESLLPLYEQLSEVLRKEQYELVFVDDGSSDGSSQTLEALCAKDLRVKVIAFSRNFGKSQALSAGFRESRGEIVITMDADLQDDPAEIPRLVASIEEGYDLVSGWKLRRQDPFTKVFPSRVFNWIASQLTGLHLHDFNCGFKAYRRRLVETLHVYGEQHRLIPALAYWKGFRVTEVGVRHHPRRWGRSKFGAWRFFAGLMDLLTVIFLMRFNRKPLHLFGLLGLLCFAAGLAINLYLTVIWFQGEPIGRRPLLLLGVLLLVMGGQFFSIGLVGEMITALAGRRAEEEHFYEVRRGVPAAVEQPEPERVSPSAQRLS